MNLIKYAVFLHLIISLRKYAQLDILQYETRHDRHFDFKTAYSQIVFESGLKPHEIILILYCVIVILLYIVDSYFYPFSENMVTMLKDRLSKRTKTKK